MSLTKTVGLFAGTTLAIAGFAFGANEANNDTAMQEIAKLKEQIAALQSQNGDNWLTEQRSAEIKGLVQDVLADADTRASLQGAGSTAGWDNGFFISSADGNFRLNINGGTQMRWTWDHRDTGDASVPAGTKENNWGFASHFTGLTFSGHIVDPSWQYMLGLNFFDNAGDYDNGTGIGTAFLTDAYVVKKFEKSWWLKVGQFLAPYSSERVISDYTMQFMDRSNSNYAFGLGRTQGIEVGFDADMFRIMASFSDGVGPNSPTQNQGYNDRAGFASSPGTDLAFTARGEVKLFGTWDQFTKQQSWRGEQFGLLMGVGGYFQSGRGGLAVPFGGGAGFPAYGMGGSQYGFTADAAANFGGWNVLGSLYYFKDDDFANGGTGGSPDDTVGLGAMIQAGFFVTNEVEIVGRYEYGDFSNFGGPGPSLGGNVVNANLQSTLSGGVNWYFAKNRAKWQSDVGYSFASVGPFFGNNGNGWQLDTTDLNGEENDGQFLIRTAITISF